MNSNLSQAPQNIPLYVFNAAGEYRMAIKQGGKFLFGNSSDNESFVVVAWEHIGKGAVFQN